MLQRHTPYRPVQLQQGCLIHLWVAEQRTRADYLAGLIPQTRKGFISGNPSGRGIDQRLIVRQGLSFDHNESPVR